MVKLNVYLLELETKKQFSFGFQFVVRYFRVSGIMGWAEKQQCSRYYFGHISCSFLSSAFYRHTERQSFELLGPQ